ncbi:MAG: hypothetical protein ACLRL6_00785 [Clostridium sp.]
MGKLMIYSGIYPNKPVQMDAHWIHKGSIQILGTANSMIAILCVLHA